MTIAARVRRRLAAEDGASIVLFALTAVVLLVMAALALDLGNAVQEKRKAQGTADATALAAAQDLASGPATPERIATSLATAQEYAADNLGVDDVHESVDCPGPPGAACYEGGDAWMVSVKTPYQSTKLTEPEESLIHVEVCRDVPTFFAAVIGIEEVRTCARATATTDVDDHGSGIPGILALGKRKEEANRGRGTKKALHNQGSVTVVDGNVQVNSRNDKEAAKLDKRSVTVADQLRVVGRISQKSPLTVTATIPSKVGVFPDPLVNLVAPPVVQADLKGAPQLQLKGEGQELVVRQPGVYGKLRVEDGATVVLEGPGVYVFSGISLKRGATLRTEGAMIYSAGKVTVDKSTLDLDAMDAGEAIAASWPDNVDQYEGIALFQARCKAKDLGTAKCGSTKQKQGEKIQLKGKKKADGSVGVWQFDGAIYAPSSKVEIKGESEAFDCVTEDEAEDGDVAEPDVGEEVEPDDDQACASDDVEDDAPLDPEVTVGFSRSLVVVAELKVGKKASIEIDTEWPAAAVYNGEVALVE